MSELLDKQVNALKEKIFRRVHVSSRKPTKKLCDENEGRKKQEKMNRSCHVIVDGVEFPEYRDTQP